jgi:hypothetical protein
MPEVYVPMSWPDLGLMAVLGLLSGAGHLMLIRAFRLAPSAIVAPFHYSQMIWAVFFGLFLFGDIPDAWVISGSAVIISSGLYILWRETVRAEAGGVLPLLRASFPRKRDPLQRAASSTPTFAVAGRPSDRLSWTPHSRAPGAGIAISVKSAAARCNGDRGSRPTPRHP